MLSGTLLNITPSLWIVQSTEHALLWIVLASLFASVKLLPLPFCNVSYGSLLTGQNKRNLCPIYCLFFRKDILQFFYPVKKYRSAFYGFSLYILLTYLFFLRTICSARWRKFHIFSICVFLIKKLFQISELKLIGETI